MGYTKRKKNKDPRIAVKGYTHEIIAKEKRE